MLRFTTYVGRAKALTAGAFTCLKDIVPLCIIGGDGGDPRVEQLYWNLLKHSDDQGIKGYVGTDFQILIYLSLKFLYSKETVIGNLWKNI